MHRQAAAAILATAAAAGTPALAQAHARPWVPAPRQYSVVYDNPQDAGGLNPATGQPYPAVGQYADTTTNTVHTTRGFSKRAIAQDVGQLFGYNTLDDGQRRFFSRLLGVDPNRWSNTHGADPQGGGGVTGDEAFADYYAMEATGGMKPPHRRRDGTLVGSSMTWGDVPIDPVKLKKFGAAIRRLAIRQHLDRYQP